MNSGINRLTQVADNFWHDSIVGFKVGAGSDPYRITYAFHDNFGNGEYAYYKSCLQDDGPDYRVTQVADKFWRDSIRGFSVSDDLATWTFYDGFGSGSYHPSQKVLDRCQCEDNVNSCGEFPDCDRCTPYCQGQTGYSNPSCVSDSCRYSTSVTCDTT
jgi:hypothetical protein